MGQGGGQGGRDGGGGGSLKVTRGGWGAAPLRGWGGGVGGGGQGGGQGGDGGSRELGGEVEKVDKM